MNTSIEWEDKSIDSLTATGIGLSQSRPFEFLQGDTLNLNIIDTRSDESINSMLTWKVDNDTIIKIIENGVVVNRPGVASLTIEADEIEIGTTNVIGTKRLAMLFFSIPDNRNLAIDDDLSSEVFVDESLSLKATYYDVRGDAVDESIQWTSSDPSIATIDENTLKPLIKGDIKLTAMVKDGAIVVKDTHSIAIINMETIVVKNGASTSLLIGMIEQLNVDYYNPRGNLVSDKEFEWISSDPSKVIVNEEGMFNAIAEGEVTITVAITINERTLQSTHIVRVIEDLTSVSDIVISSTKNSFDVGDTYQLQAEATNLNGDMVTIDDYSWESSDPQVGIISNKGLFTAIGSGTTTIMASHDFITSDGLEFTVINVDNVLITSTKNSFDIGETYQFQAKATDMGTIINIEQYSWVSTMPVVGTINNTGLFTAIAPGTTTITASYNEIVSNELELTVIDPNDVDNILATIEITSEGDETTIIVGNVLQMNAIGKNSSDITLSDIDYSWASSNIDVATIDMDGLVTGVAAGDVSITATSESITSNAFMLTITPKETNCSSDERIGSSLSSELIAPYLPVGTVKLYYQEINGVCKLYLELGNDFSVSANVPSPAIYLSNLLNPPDLRVSGGLQVIKNNSLNNAAGMSFEVPGNPGIEEYKYVHYYCFPFNIITGTYEFAN